MWNIRAFNFETNEWEIVGTYENRKEANEIAMRIRDEFDTWVDVMPTE